jgi:hypothetical protein
MKGCVIINTGKTPETGLKIFITTSNLLKALAQNVRRFS